MMKGVIDVNAVMQAWVIGNTVIDVAVLVLCCRICYCIHKPHKWLKKNLSL